MAFVADFIPTLAAPVSSLSHLSDLVKAVPRSKGPACLGFELSREAYLGNGCMLLAFFSTDKCLARFSSVKFGVICAFPRPIDVVEGWRLNYVSRESSDPESRQQSSRGNQL